ncbi:MAG: tandem-95 repeat protein, partial [Candidatus Hydrogenedentes bacterium]|nr:tandem-95 repeat protein [Candidatus Hydrogenedentota bacterium]
MNTHVVRNRFRSLCGGLAVLLCAALSPVAAFAAPVANAGGPYNITEAQGVTLDGSGSTGATSYDWDLDNDTQYDDATGVSPSINVTLLRTLLLVDGAHTIGLRVSDGTNTDTDTATLTITNLAPTSNPGGPYTINEGQSVSLNGSESSDPGNDPLTYEWDLDDDGQYDDSTDQNPVIPWNTWKAIKADGAAVVRLRVTDSGNAANLNSTAATTVTVTNLAPTSVPGGPYTINEGQDVVLNGSGSTDPGGDTLTYSWDLNNDSTFGDATGATPTITWAAWKAIRADGAQTIQLRVTDSGNSANLSHTASTTVTVTNLAPTANAGGPYVISQGTGLSVDASASSDPGGDTLTYSWDLDNNGTFGDATGMTPSLNWGQTKAYINVGVNTIQVRVTDSSNTANLSHTASTTVTLGNVAPTAEAGGPYTINEGQQLLLDGSGSNDPGGDTLTYSWDLNNDGTFGDTTGVSPTVPWATLKTFITDGANTIKLRVTETGNSPNLSSDDTATVTITNLAPVAGAGGPYAINEGQALGLNASGSSDPGGDPLTHSWDLDNDGTFGDATGASPTVPWATLKTFITDGVNPITVRVTDSGNAANLSNDAPTTVTITNLAPTAVTGGPYAMDEGQDLQLNAASSSDPGGDTLTYEWDLDNDSVFGDVSGVSPLVTWATLKGFISLGSNTIGLRVTDSGNAVNLSHTATTTLTVTDLAPAAVDDAYSTAETTVLSVPAPGVLGNDSDSGGYPISVDVGKSDTESAQGVTLSLEADGTFAYDPRLKPEFNALALGESVDDTFSYTITDGALESSAVVTVTVNGENDAPVVAADSKYLMGSIDEDNVGNAGTTVTALLASGPAVTDPDATDPRGVAVTEIDLAHGIWEYRLDGGGAWMDFGLISPANALLLGANDRLRFVPELNYNGTVEDAFKFVAWDQSAGTSGGKADASTGGGDAAFSTVTASADITVNPVNDPPVLADDTVITQEDTQIVINVLANDFDVEGLDPATVFVTVMPLHGSRGVQADGSIVYIPNLNYNGPDQFTYRVWDIGDNGAPALMGTATVNVTVEAVNDPPTAREDVVYADGGFPVVIDVLANDTDVDGAIDPDISIFTPPAHGQITDIDPLTGAVTYLPDADFQGIDTFFYEVFDTGNPLPTESALGKVTVAVSQTDITVDTLDDNNDGDFSPGNISLREALTFVADGGTVLFDDTIFGPGLNTIALVLGELPVTRSVTLIGPGADRLEISGGDASRVLHVKTGTLQCSGLRFVHGRVSNAGGGGIRVASGAGLALDGCVVSDSEARDTNSALDDLGGGIFSEGDLVLRNSTIHGNFAGAYGGGVYSVGTLEAVNCTLTDNTALEEDGGAIHHGGAAASILYCTIVFNTAESGGGVNKTSGDMELSGSIIAGNTATDGAPDVDGIILSLGGNVIGDPAATAGWTGEDLLNVDADELVEPELGDNGGTTPTLALLADSPAINAGHDTAAAAAGILEDQRGFSRLDGHGGMVDAGAYEVRFHYVDSLIDEDDSDTGPGNFSLREAVGLALPGDNIEITVPGTILFDPTLGGDLGEIIVINGLGIRGNGEGRTVLDGGGATPLLYLPSVTTQMVLWDMDLQNAFDAPQPAGAGRGGPVLFSFGTVRAVDCVFKSNTAQSLSGGAVQNLGFMRFTGCLFEGNTAGDVGGALLNAGGQVELLGCSFTSNTATQLGGAVANVLGGSLSIRSTRFQENAALVSGGALHNTANSETVARNVLFNANTAASDGGAVNNLGRLTLVNGTVSGNTAGRNGGGLYHTGPKLDMTNVTVTGNLADSVNSGVAEGGGLSSTGTVSMRNTVVAANYDTPNNAGQGNIRADISGAALSLGNNLLGNRNGSSGLVNGQNGDLVGTATQPLDPGLGPLADYGGVLAGHMPKVASPLIDAGANDAVAAPLFDGPPFTDQRGEPFSRVVDGNGDESAETDIGAVEYVPTQPQFTSTPLEDATEDVAYLHTVVMQDQDLAEIFTITAPVLPYWLEFTDNGDGTATLSGTPSNEEALPDFILREYEVLVEVVDWAGQTNGQSFTITLLGVNDAPVAEDDEAETAEDVPVTIPVLDNDSDVDGAPDPATVTVIDGPAHGSVTVDPETGAVTYTPDLHYNGTDSFIYEVTDDGAPVPLLSDTATVSLTILAVNDPPAAVDDTAATDEDTPVVVYVLANDSDVDGNLVVSSLAVVTAPAHGTAVVDTDTGLITYTPGLNYYGGDSFVYRITDDGAPLPAEFSTATVTVTVNPVNDAPVANDDTATTNEDTSVVVAVLANDTDVDGATDPATVAIVTPPANGAVSIDPATGAVTYTPNLDFNGQDTFAYEVFDDGYPLPALSDTATVAITVNPVNDPPVAVDDAAATDEDTPVTVDVLDNDSDVDGVPLPASVVVVQAPASGTTLVEPVTGAITYIPGPDFNGTDSFVYRVTDDGFPLPALTGTATVTITVNPVNDEPRLQDDSATTDEDTPVTVNVLANDADVDGNLDISSMRVVSGPDHGTASVNPATGAVTYTPDKDYYGPDALFYEISDDGFPAPALSSVAVLNLTVTPVNDAPVAVDDNAATDEDTPVTVDVLANDSDVDAALVPASVTVVVAPAHGTVSINPATGAVTYTPAADYYGGDSFVYSVADNGFPTPALTSQAKAFITVNPVNDTPRLQPDSAGTPEDTPVLVRVLDNDTDVDGNLVPGSVMVTAPPAHGAAVVNPANGRITYTPDKDYFGTDSFSYSVTDDGFPLPALTSESSVTVFVQSVNDAPRTGPDSAETLEDTPVVVDVLANDTDVDGNLVPDSVRVVTPPLHGTVTVNPATGALTYTPDADYNGVENFSYAVSDDGAPLPALETAEQVTVTVRAVNDAPRTQPDVVETPEDTPIVVDVLANDMDVDGNLVPASVRVVTPPFHGTVTVNPATGACTYSPNANYHGADGFVYEVSDDGSPLPALVSTGQVLIAVGPVNDNIVANDDTAVTDEDTPVVIPVLANDTDIDGEPDPNVVLIAEAPAHGRAEVNSATGAVTYTPDEHFNGVDSFTYLTFDDGYPLPPTRDTATVTVTVRPVNDPPVISTDRSVRHGFQEQPVPLAPLSVADLDVLETPGGVLELRLDAPNGRFLVDPVDGVEVLEEKTGVAPLVMRGE